MREYFFIKNVENGVFMYFLFFLFCLVILMNVLLVFIEFFFMLESYYDGSIKDNVD